MCSARTCVFVYRLFSRRHICRCKHRSEGRRQRASSCSRNVWRVVGWHLVLFLLSRCVCVCRLGHRVARRRTAHMVYVLTLTALCGRHLGPTTGEGPLLRRNRPSRCIRRHMYKNVEATTPSRATQHRHPPSPPQPRRDEGEDCTFFFVRGGCGGTRAPLSCRPANG